MLEIGRGGFGVPLQVHTIQLFRTPHSEAIVRGLLAVGEDFRLPYCTCLRCHKFQGASCGHDGTHTQDRKQIKRRRGTDLMLPALYFMPELVNGSGTLEELLHLA